METLEEAVEKAHLALLDLRMAERKVGKPSGLTDKDGNMIFFGDFEIPPDCYIFFLRTDEWLALKK